MIRQIIIPTQNSYLLHLPDNLIGKKVEVIAFAPDDIVNEPPTEVTETKRTIEQAVSFFRKNAVNFTTLEKWTREDLYE